MIFRDFKHKDTTEIKKSAYPDPIFPGEVDVSDLSSQYTEDIETLISLTPGIVGQFPQPQCGVLTRWLRNRSSDLRVLRLFF